MKKLVLFFAVVAAVSFASCGNKAAQETAPAQDTTAVVDTTAAVAVDTVAAPADSAVAAQ